MSDKLQAAFAVPSKEQVNRLVGLFSAGHYPQALVLGRGLAKQFPQIPFFPNLLGIIHYHQDNLESAVTSFQKALALHPNYDEAHNNLGNVLKDLGRFEEAVTCYQQALGIKPDYAEAYNNLAMVLIEQKQFTDAMAAFKQALLIKPDYGRAYQNYADLLFDLERYDEAASLYSKALQIEPQSCELHLNYSLALRKIGQNELALDSAKKAVEIKPDYVKAHNNLGDLYKSLGRSEEALLSYLKSVTIEQDNNLHLRNIAGALTGISFVTYTNQWADIFQRILSSTTIARPSDIVLPIVSLLKQHPGIQNTLLALSRDGFEHQAENLCVELAELTLFMDILALCPMPDLEIEHLLIELRKHLLFSRDSILNKQGVLNFQVALALNCFTNEYVLEETIEEESAVAILQEELESRAANNEVLEAYDLVCLAGYRPLCDYDWIQEIAVPKGLESLFERLIYEVQEERRLRTGLPSIKAIDNKISAVVRQQYEENPYPRWINTQILPTPLTISEMIESLGLKLSDPTISFSAEPEVLVAGCGTGQHSICTAGRFANSKVLAIDLSLSSLSYALRKTTEFGIDNIDYLQGDILDLGMLDKQFDIVESAGVIHHMDDPMAGWTVLTDCLKPGGLMKIAVYSETARQHVVKARKLIAERGLSSSPGDMKAFRKEINNTDDELLSKLGNYRDLYSLSELRDLLFHVQEHRFTIPQIKSCLETLGLSFAGFESVNEKHIEKFKQAYSDSDALYDLDVWHQFELDNPEVFLGMYQFWLQKNTG